MNINVNDPKSQNGQSNSGPDAAKDPQVKPKKAKRRKYTAKQKLKILEDIDALDRGEVGAYLRRNGLYSSSVSNWRKQRDQGQLDAMKPKKRGAKPKSAEARRIAQLEREAAKLQKELERANLIIGVQKKLCDLFGIDSMTGEELK
jgi:transposase